jgi:hypothetical protein
MNDPRRLYSNQYQHPNGYDDQQQEQEQGLYNNGLRPILPQQSSSPYDDHNFYAGGSSPHNLSRSHHRWWNRVVSSCPIYVVTYVTMHLDTISKILNHCIGMTLLGNVFLFVSSFAISYYEDQKNHIGFNTVFCAFLLCTISIINLLIINNNRISALSMLAPTEFMIGVATGMTFSALIITMLLSSTYRSAMRLCHHSIQSRHLNLLTTNSTDAATTTTNTGNNYGSNSNMHYKSNNDSTQYYDDPLLIETCTNHIGTITSIWFWSTLLIWFNIIILVLFIVGRYELSAHTTQQYSYDPIYGGDGVNSHEINTNHNHTSTPVTTTATTTNGTYPMPQPTQPAVDFEEQFRRQQQEILGIHNVTALRDRVVATTAMFVGDYSTIPEVTQPQLPTNTTTTSTQRNSGPQILSV